MSENFPFPAAEEAEPAGGDRRKMALVAGVGALLVAVLGYFVVLPALSGGGGADDSTVTLVKKPAQKNAKTKAGAKAKPKAAKAPAAKKPPTQPATYSELSARANPFRPLWVEPKQQVGTSAPGGAAPAPGMAPGAQPVTQPSGQQSSGGSAASVGGQRVALMTVYSKEGANYAQTRIGDVVYTPRVGQVFAVSYKLLAVSGKTATYLYGDEQFTLSVGQEVLK